MERYNVVEFKRKGPTSFILGSLLKLFTPSWDKWGWHLAIAWERVFDGWMILEALSGGVQVKFHSDKELMATTRNYKWLTNTDELTAHALLKEFQGKKYDVAVYFFTALAIIIRHYFNRPIPKLLDSSYTCWELVQEFCCEMGRPICSKYDVVIITDMIEALKTGQTSINHI